MNSVKLQDIKSMCRNLPHFCKSRVKQLKENLRKQSHSHSKNKLNQRGERPLEIIIKKNKTTDERNVRCLKEIERHSMLMGWKKKYYYNVYTTQSNLQI